MALADSLKATKPNWRADKVQVALGHIDVPIPVSIGRTGPVVHSPGAADLAAAIRGARDAGPATPADEVKRRAPARNR